MIDKSQLRLRPGFLLVLFLIVIGCGWLVLSSNRRQNHYKIMGTHLYERQMAVLLQEEAQGAGGLTNITDEFICRACTATNAILFIVHTNDSGELLDFWQTPFQITLIGPTNFTIRSAGPDKHFGDRDDIVFNTVSNGFVNP
jgi:hypothetical protein